AEDGIRDLIVTGVQTCALPIFDFLIGVAMSAPSMMRPWMSLMTWVSLALFTTRATIFKQSSAGRPLFRSVENVTAKRLMACLERSEERRVGKECRSRSAT